MLWRIVYIACWYDAKIQTIKVQMHIRKIEYCAFSFSLNILVLLSDSHDTHLLRQFSLCNHYSCTEYRVYIYDNPISMKMKKKENKTQAMRQRREDPYAKYYTQSHWICHADVIVMRVTRVCVVLNKYSVLLCLLLLMLLFVCFISFFFAHNKHTHMSSI